MKFSKDGYKRNSKDRNNPYNIIASGNITMKDVDFPVFGIDNLGNIEIMMPGGEYKFPGDSVFEIPLAQMGREFAKLEKMISDYLNNPGDKATDFSESDEVVGIDGDGKPMKANIDNLRHASAGRYTAEELQNLVKGIPYVGSILDATGVDKLAGFLGSNILGVGHEVATLIEDDRSFFDALSESGEDVFNNFVGSIVGSTDISSERKDNILKFLSYNNLLPDGYVATDKNLSNNVYFKDSDGNVKKANFDSYQDGGGFMNQIKAMYDDAMVKYKQYEKEGYKLPSHKNPILNDLMQGYIVKGGFNGEDFEVYDANGKLDPMRTNLANLYNDVTPYIDKVQRTTKKIRNLLPFSDGGEDNGVTRVGDKDEAANAIQFMYDWTNSPMHDKMLLSEIQRSNQDVDDFNYVKNMRLFNLDTAFTTYDAFNAGNSGGSSFSYSGQVNLNKNRGDQTAVHEYSHASDRPTISSMPYNQIYNMYKSGFSLAGLGSLIFPSGHPAEPGFPYTGKRLIPPVSNQLSIPSYNIKKNNDGSRQGNVQDLKHWRSMKDKWRDKEWDEVKDSWWIDEEYGETVADMFSDKKTYDNWRNKIDDNIEIEEDWINYVTEPTEVRARLNAIRMKAHELGIYDVFNEPINEEQYNELVKRADEQNDKSEYNALYQLRDIYPDDKIFEMLNTFSDAGQNAITPEDQNNMDNIGYDPNAMMAQDGDEVQEPKFTINQAGAIDDYRKYLGTLKQSGGELPKAQDGTEYMIGPEGAPRVADDYESYGVDISFDELERGIRHVESLNGELMLNPESSATGLYGQLWSEIGDMYEGSREEFSEDLDFQKELFRKRAYGEIEGIPGLIDAGRDVYNEYKDVEHGLSMLDIAALANFLGRQGAREYIGYHIRDGKPLESVFPKLYGDEAKYTNKKPNEYIELFRKGVLSEKSSGGEILKKLRRIKQQLDKYNHGEEISGIALSELKKRGFVKPKVMRDGGPYTVQKGDVLSRLAADRNMSVKEIVDLNPKFKGREGSIFPGEQIFFDQETRNVYNSNNPIYKHEIKYGDTLGEIANKYRVDMADLVNLNNITNIDNIIAGQNLVLPANAVFEENENTKKQEEIAKSVVTDNDDVIVNGKHPNNQVWLKRKFNVETGMYENISGKRQDIKSLNKHDNFTTIVEGMNDIHKNANKVEDYTVKKDDTLSALANKFNTSVYSIMADNNIKDKDTIQIGQKLKINTTTAKPYLVIDEQKGKMHLIYPGEVRPMESYNILTGSATGDQATVTKGTYFYNGEELTQDELNDAMKNTNSKNVRELLEVPGYTSKIDWTGGNRQTGAGVYYISESNRDGGRAYRGDSRGEAVPSFNLVNDNGIEQATAIHGVTYSRVNELYNPDTDSEGNTRNTKLTTGCINGKCTDLQSLYDNPDVDKGTQVFILPEDEGNNFVYENGKINFYASRTNIEDAEENFERVNKAGEVLGTVEGGPGINVTNINNIGNYKPIQFEFDKDLYKNSSIADGSMANLQEEYIVNTKPYLDGLANNKKDLMDILNIDGDLYNDIALVAFGIYGNESAMGDINDGIGVIEDKLKQFRKWYNTTEYLPDNRPYLFGLRSDTAVGSGSVRGKYSVASDPSQSVGWTQLRVGYGFTTPAERELLAKADEKFGTKFAIPLNGSNGGLDDVRQHPDYDSLSEAQKEKAAANKYKGGIYIPKDANGLPIKGMKAQYHEYKIDNSELMDPEKSAIATMLILAQRYRSQIPAKDRNSSTFDIFNELPKTWRPGKLEQQYANLVQDNMQYVTLTESDIDEFEEGTIAKGSYRSGGEFGLENQIQFYNDYVKGLYDNTKQSKSANKLYDKINRMYYNDYRGTQRNALDIMNQMNTKRNN